MGGYQMTSWNHARGYHMNIFIKLLLFIVSQTRTEQKTKQNKKIPPKNQKTKVEM